MSDKKIKELDEQVMALSRELDDMRKNHNRLSMAFQQLLKNGLMTKKDFDTESAGVRIVLDAIHDLLVQKNVFSLTDFAEMSEICFDKSNGMIVINPEGKDELEEGEYTMVKFVCLDDEGVMIFAEPNYVLYQLGIGKLPFESVLRKLKPGQKDEFKATFPDNFSASNARGKTLNVKAECKSWKDNVLKKLKGKMEEQALIQKPSAEQFNRDRPDTVTEIQ